MPYHLIIGNGLSGFFLSSPLVKFTSFLWNPDRKNTPGATDGKSQLKQLVSAYLDADYSNPDVSPCPLAYLVTDVANREPEVRSAYARSFELLSLKIKDLISIDGFIRDEETILALTTIIIGSVAIARTIPDSAKIKLLTSCKKIAFDLIDKA